MAKTGTSTSSSVCVRGPRTPFPMQISLILSASGAVGFSSAVYREKMDVSHQQMLSK